MKKKILFVVFALFMFFSLTSNSYAIIHRKTVCNYRDDTGDYYVNVKIDLDKKYVNKAIISNVSGKNAKNVSTNWKIVNWNQTLVGTRFRGDNYYETNEKCPPVLFVVYGYGAGLVTFIVNDNKNFSNYNTYINKTYKEVYDGYPIVLTVYEQEEVEEEYEPTSCLDFDKDPFTDDRRDWGTCENNKYFACVWNKTSDGGYCNVDKLQYVKCGSSYDIPKEAPSIVSFVINLLKIATPIVLVIVSAISLLKAIAASKEDELKKAQTMLIKRLIAAALVFLVVSIVQFVILRFADSSEEGDIKACLSCFLNNDCSSSVYYKTNIAGYDVCTTLSGNNINCGN
jgi:hypothetical protein